MMLAAVAEQSRLERKVVFAPIIEEKPQPDSIRIKAMIDPNYHEICHFMVDRPLLRDFSARFDSSVDGGESPLAKTLFEVGGLTEIVIHQSVVSASRDPAIDEAWRTMAEEIGSLIRGHLLANLDIVSRAFRERIPPEEAIISRVQKVIDEQINPQLSQHAGGVRLERVKNNTIWLNMEGSCQGCAEARLTFRHGIGEVLRRVIPGLGAIYDATDHYAGVNPYFPLRAEEDQDHEAA
jgi:Fe-S cluster biogenesis protein NfuA